MKTRRVRYHVAVVQCPITKKPTNVIYLTDSGRWIAAFDQASADEWDAKLNDWQSRLDQPPV